MHSDWLKRATTLPSADCWMEGLGLSKKRSADGLRRRRLLASLHAREAGGNRIGIIAGRKDEGYAARRQCIRHRIGHFASQIDVEDSSIQFAVFNSLERGTYVRSTPDDVSACRLQICRHVHRDQILVLDHQNTLLGNR